MGMSFRCRVVGSYELQTREPAIRQGNEQGRPVAVLLLLTGCGDYNKRRRRCMVDGMSYSGWMAAYGKWWIE